MAIKYPLILSASDDHRGVVILYIPLLRGKQGFL